MSMELKIESLEVKKIGKMQHVLGFNWVALIVLNGEAYTAIRQGGLGIWAFADRSKFDRKDLDYLDETCNEELRLEEGIL